MSFNEFVVDCPVSAAQVNRAIDAAGMIGGFEIGSWYPELGENALLLAFTELTTRQQVDAMVRVLSSLTAAAPVA